MGHLANPKIRSDLDLPAYSDVTIQFDITLQAAILDGTQPPELTLKRLVSVTHPLDWSEQERLFGF